MGLTNGQIVSVLLRRQRKSVNKVSARVPHLTDFAPYLKSSLKAEPSKVSSGYRLLHELQFGNDTIRTVLLVNLERSEVSCPGDRPNYFCRHLE